MKKIVFAISIVTLAGLAFAAGRFTAQPPQYQTSHPAQGGELAVAF
jgi:hypothetical protein